jgi:hypothetical protein
MEPDFKPLASLTPMGMVQKPTETFEPCHNKTNIIGLRPAWIHAVRLPTLLQVEKLIANSMNPDQTARMRRLVWIHAGRKPTMLVLS